MPVSAGPGLILLDGPTGAGKSTVLGMMRGRSGVTVGAKATTRPRRKGDTDWEFRFVSSGPTPSHEWLTFGSVGHEYSVHLSEIDDALTRGQVYVISCVDRDVIEQLLERYVARVVYVYRPLSMQELAALLKDRETVGEADVALRREEVQGALTRYAERLPLYSHVLLNTGDKTHLQAQVDALLGSFQAAASHG